MYTYMEDALDYLTDYASKHHIKIMWASLSPITPPGSNFEYRSVVMNSNWHNPKEFIFQLAHEISHVIHGDKGDIYYYHACFTGRESVEYKANLGAVSYWYLTTVSIAIGKTLTPMNLKRCSMFRRT